MPEVLIDILPGVVWTGVVALLSYAFGIKKIKNQADRAKVQDIYTRLLNEFEAIDKALDAQPKILSDYPCKREWHKETYVTPLSEIFANGDYIFLSENQREELKKLEEEAFAYGEKALKLVQQISDTFG